MKIAFLLPQNVIGGGHITVYKHARYLQSQGHELFIIYREYVKGRDEQMIKDFNFNILSFDHPQAKSLQLDVIFATWWETLYDTFVFDSKYYFYYIQSDERRFYEDQALLKVKFCELTYRFRDIGIITVASWMQKKLMQESGIEAKVAPNGIDEKVFNPNGRKSGDSGKLRVLIEGHGNIWFRRIDDCFKATNAIDNIEVWYVSRDGYSEPSWRYDKKLVNISSSEMAEVYSACDVLLKMSEVESFCLPNLEMMASGGTIITANFTGHEEYAVNGQNSIIIPIRGTEEARSAILKLRDDRKLLAQLKANALDTARSMTWDIQNKKFESVFAELVSEYKGYDYSGLKRQMLLLREIKLSVEIGEKEKEKLLTDYSKLFHQHHRNEYRLLRLIGRAIYRIPLLGPLLRKLFL